MFSTYRQLSLLHAKENFKCNVLYLPPINTFKCNVLYLPPIITFKCNVLYWHPIITFTCNLKFSSVLFSNYHFYIQSEIFKCTVLYWLPIWSLLHTKVWNAVLYWHPIITFTCNLKFSSVMFSTYRQLSLLHAKVCNLKFSSVMFSTDIQLSLLHAIWKFQV